MGEFRVLKKATHSRARLGVLETAHGFLETPAYAIVATHGAVKAIHSTDFEGAGIKLLIANTYHLWRSLGEEGLKTFRGVHTLSGSSGPIMTDSGGFQVFSFGAARSLGGGKVLGKSVAFPGENLVRVTEEGVYFQDEGKEHYLDAELSIKIQEQLGADIIVAFDEPSSPHHDFDYTRAAMERTHRWAKRCLAAKKSQQLLYGVTQGGFFESLRKESATVLGQMDFQGFGIGGCFGNSYGSSESATRAELEWSIPYLPEDKPRHLLGMGRVIDIFHGVEAGIDTFDCVIPTREARHGSLWTKSGRFDIKKASFLGTSAKIEEDCLCPACSQGGVTRGELSLLFKEKNPEAGRLATLHNVYFFNHLMEEVREALKDDSLELLKKKYAYFL